MPTKRDATHEALTVTFHGASYSVPPADDWDLTVLEEIDAGRSTSALRALLGDEQYATFREKHTKVSALKEFFAVAGKAVGAGNS